MYSIQTIIYGIPMTPEAAELIAVWEEGIDIEGNELTEEKWFETEDGVCGFTTLYHGGADGLIGYCGIALKELDECETYRGLSEFKAKATEEEKETALKLIEQVPDELLNLCPGIGYYVIYSTS